ncbi:MAG: YqaJ viral recombinase family protein, partial [Bradyrhizobium sp.]|nr:YqaJ viral recombinase family protein [Bradyrhizobium sp.]
MAMVEQDRAAWLEERKTGIGASEAAAALGVNPYKSPMELWAEKCGLTEPPDLSENEAAEFGVRLEPVIAEAFAARTGRRVELWPQDKIVRSTEHVWMICTPDATQQCDGDGNAVGVLQIKTANEFLSSAWKDGPPLHYQVQCQHELTVTGCDWGTLVVLIGGQKLRYFDFEANPKFQAALIGRLGNFWEAIETRTPPEIDASLSTARILEKLHPMDNGESVALPEEALQWDADLKGAKAKVKDLEELIRDRENRIKAAVGDCTFGVLPDGGRFSWKH